TYARGLLKDFDKNRIERSAGRQKPQCLQVTRGLAIAVTRSFPELAHVAAGKKRVKLRYMVENQVDFRVHHRFVEDRKVAGGFDGPFLIGAAIKPSLEVQALRFTQHPRGVLENLRAQFVRAMRVGKFAG